MSGLWTPAGANRGLPEVRGGFTRERALEEQLPPGIEPGTRVYSRGPVRILLSKHPDTRRWHLSISCADRDPTWEEIRDARYSLLPDGVIVAMILPPRAEYLNVHEHCFHLHQVSRDAVDL